jgi:hypothetical protein
LQPSQPQQQVMVVQPQPVLSSRHHQHNNCAAAAAVPPLRLADMLQANAASTAPPTQQHPVSHAPVQALRLLQQETVPAGTARPQFLQVVDIVDGDGGGGRAGAWARPAKSAAAGLLAPLPAPSHHAAEWGHVTGPGAAFSARTPGSVTSTPARARRAGNLVGGEVAAGAGGGGGMDRAVDGPQRRLGGAVVQQSADEAVLPLQATVPRAWMYGDGSLLGAAGAAPLHAGTTTREEAVATRDLQGRDCRG